ncbi:hypothetical protein LJR009_000020 [Bosea sp. LjRoot9]|uniref:hypothetical protein n=1 Tax=Bosea sp. LjRoot9 TaxID=3342341 RepID=UPI003ED0CAB0
MDRQVLGRRETQPPVDDILAALDELLASETLRLSERNRRFLSFVVNQAVAGHADRIKAYLIGVDVFGRDETFDPNIDPIVRIEATRLRSALTAHYDGSGADVPVRISIPPGSYAPVFSWSSAAGSGEEPLQPALSRVGLTEPHHSTILLKDQTVQSDTETALRAGLFADALAIRLNQAHFKVFAVPPVEHIAATRALNDLLAQPHNAYALDVVVREMGDSRRFSWRASDLRNGEIRCGDFRDLRAASTPCFAAIDAIADVVVASLCSELGVQSAAH